MNKRDAFSKYSSHKNKKKLEILKKTINISRFRIATVRESGCVCIKSGLKIQIFKLGESGAAVHEFEIA